MTDKYSQSIPIPTEYVPYIIGKGGRTITNIENGSHSRISISQDSHKEEWHYVRITGGNFSIDKAKKWIVKCLISAIENNYKISETK